MKILKIPRSAAKVTPHLRRTSSEIKRSLDITSKSKPIVTEGALIVSGEAHADVAFSAPPRIAEVEFDEDFENPIGCGQVLGPDDTVTVQIRRGHIRIRWRVAEGTTRRIIWTMTT